MGFCRIVVDILTQMFTRVHFPRTYIGASFTKQDCGQIFKQFSNLDSLGLKLRFSPSVRPMRPFPLLSWKGEKYAVDCFRVF